jgi:uncharacterized membrane protein YuzA (DUF378 family)
VIIITNNFDKLAYVLVVIGGLNWGFVGWLNFNLVDTIFGAGSMLSRVVYAVVGAAALYMVYAMVTMMTSKNAA